MIKKINKIYGGFTLIETLVAITILMIAIAGPLTVANKGYTSSIENKTRAVAMNLAQEGLEYLNNLKDNRAFDSNEEWEPYTEKYFSVAHPARSACKSNAPCDFPAIPGTDSSVTLESLGIKYRKYYFERINDDPEQITVVVKVGWDNGIVTNELVLEQVFTNYHR